MSHINSDKLSVYCCLNIDADTMFLTLNEQIFMQEYNNNQTKFSKIEQFLLKKSYSILTNGNKFIIKHFQVYDQNEETSSVYSIDEDFFKQEENNIEEINNEGWFNKSLDENNDGENEDKGNKSLNDKNESRNSDDDTKNNNEIENLVL